jgi:hypothetical protein
VKELWEQAILTYNLPLTIALAAVMAFWLFALLGAIGLDLLDIDADADADLPAEGFAAFPAALLRFVNAGHVPVTIVLSVLVLAMWMLSVTLNWFFNPAASLAVAGGLFIAVFVLAVAATKLLTQPFVPLMRRLKQAENAKPVVGESGVVRSGEVTARYGQVEVVREGGAPALLNCRLAEGAPPLARGAEVLVVGFDPAAGQYIVRPLAHDHPAAADALSTAAAAAPEASAVPSPIASPPESN